VEIRNERASTPLQVTPADRSPITRLATCERRGRLQGRDCCARSRCGAEDHHGVLRPRRTHAMKSRLPELDQGRQKAFDGMKGRRPSLATDCRSPRCSSSSTRERSRCTRCRSSRGLRETASRRRSMRRRRWPADAAPARDGSTADERSDEDGPRERFSIRHYEEQRTRYAAGDEAKDGAGARGRHLTFLFENTHHRYRCRR